MRMYDIIYKKRNGGELTDEEIRYLVKGCTDETIEDYHLAVLCMAIYFRGMTKRETQTLTQEMAKSGDCIDLSGVEGYTVDKHSTGGVGDKTSLIVAPIVAALGGKVAKMSGRGLGHTGGTVDKLEAIPGFKTELSPEDFLKQVNDIGLCIVGQTGKLAPADKRLYKLRDVTATVESIPLIASSIMSKKLAAGSKGIVLDVKTGSGAFMKSVDEAEILAREMVDIGKAADRAVAAVITDMDVPLGNFIGNSLEVIEAIEVLKGKVGGELREICLTLAAEMLSLVTGESSENCFARAEQAIENGAAFKKLREMIERQGGNPEVTEDYSLFKQPKYCFEIATESDGYICSMNAEKVGLASVLLGAGREKKDDSIDPSAGIVLRKKTGDYIKKGETLAVFYTDDQSRIDGAREVFLSAFEYSTAEPQKHRLIYKIIK